MDTSLDAGVSDADLIAASLAEPEMFTAIFDRHAGEILRYVHSRLGGDLAQDVMAETFLAAFRYRGGMTGRGRTQGPGCTGLRSGRSASTGGPSRVGCGC